MVCIEFLLSRVSPRLKPSLCLPAGDSSWWFQPLTWPWCPAGLCTPGSGAAPLTGSETALTISEGLHWAATSARHSRSSISSGCSPSWTSYFSWSPSWSPSTQLLLSHQYVRWSLCCFPQSAGASLVFVQLLLVLLSQLIILGLDVHHDLVEVLKLGASNSMVNLGLQTLYFFLMVLFHEE